MSADTVLVVGGRAGIGAAIADHFGDRSVVWSRRHGVDATDEHSLRAATDSLVAERGAPFALVHTVGDYDEAPLLDTATATYRHLLESNLTTTFLVVRTVVPHLVAAGRGRVVLFAAAATDRANRRSPVYFAINAAIVALTRSLALEVAPHGVTANVISPGVIRHPTSHQESQDRVGPIPLGRDGTPEDIVGAVDHLLSPAASYVTGTELVVDGGLSQS